MRNLGRRIGAAIRMGLIWGAAWSAAAFVVARVPGFDSDLPFAFLFAPFGFVTGILFFGILAMIEGRRALDRVPPVVFAVAGAVSGVLPSETALYGRFAAGFVFVAALRGRAPGREALVFGTALALAGTASAVASLAMARRSGTGNLPRPTAEPDRGRT